MAIAAHLAYALAIAVFFGLSVGFGAVGLFPDPIPPPIPPSFGIVRDEPPTPEEQRQAIEEQQAFFEKRHEVLQDHRRNQLIGITLLCAIAIIAGVTVSVLPPALRLGSILGGLGTVIWGVIHSRDFVSDGAVFELVLVIFLLLASLSVPTIRRRLRSLIRLSEPAPLLRGDSEDQA